MSPDSTDGMATEAIDVGQSRWGRTVGWVNAHRPRTWWVNAILVGLLVLALVLAFMVIGNPPSSNQGTRTVAVTRGTVTATVSGSGNTESSLSTPVNFEVNGTVTAIKVNPGDTVTAGQVLATIDPSAQNFELRTAQASLSGAEANLAQASSGPTEVKQAQDQNAIEQAQQTVETDKDILAAAQKQRDLDDKATASAIEYAEQKYDDDKATTDTAIRQAQAQLRSDQQATPSPSASCVDVPPGTCNAEQAAASQQADATVKKDQLAVRAAQQDQNTILNADEQQIKIAKQNRADTLAKDDAAITNAHNNVESAEKLVTAAQLTAQADLHPMTPDQIAAVEATVDTAQVQVDSAQQAVDQTTLQAPQAGTVLAVTGKVGLSTGNGNNNNSSSGTSSGSSGGNSGGSSSSNAGSTASSSASNAFITIANPSQLAVTANIAEADAAKIKLGQQATVTFPATGTTTTGSVTQITPQSQVTNNVVLYPIQVSLDTAPPGVGVGATAALAITTGTATDVLEAPTSAITTLGNRHTVTVRRNGQDTVVPVQIGLSGDTTTEITSGAQEGDMLVLPTVTPAPGGTGGGGATRPGGG